MVVTTRSKRDVVASNKVCESNKRKLKKYRKPSESKRKKKVRTEIEDSDTSTVTCAKTDNVPALSKEHFRKLISELPATVIESLKYRGVEKGQWKVYIAESDTAPRICVTQEDRLLAKAPLRQT